MGAGRTESETACVSSEDFMPSCTVWAKKNQNFKRSLTFMTSASGTVRKSMTSLFLNRSVEWERERVGERKYFERFAAVRMNLWQEVGSSGLGGKIKKTGLSQPAWHWRTVATRAATKSDKAGVKSVWAERGWVGVKEEGGSRGHHGRGAMVGWSGVTSLTKRINRFLSDAQWSGHVLVFLPVSVPQWIHFALLLTKGPALNGAGDEDLSPLRRWKGN